MEKTYFSEIDGVNSRMDEIHAGILRYKLRQLDNHIQRRREIAKLYTNELFNTEYILPTEEPNSKHSYYLYVLRHEKRNEIIEFLKKDKLTLTSHILGRYIPCPPIKNIKQMIWKILTNLPKPYLACQCTQLLQITRC